MGATVTKSEQRALHDTSAQRHLADTGGAGETLVMNFPAVPVSVARVRVAIASYATRIGAGPSLVERLSLAVSEAATNVVLHAYDEASEAGVVDLEASVGGGELRVSVADTGTGLRVGHRSPGLGLGLAIVGELADKVELLQGANGGLRLLMRFALPAKSFSGRGVAALTVSRIGGLGDLGRLADLFHDDIGLFVLDDVLDRRNLVARHQHEMRRTRPHALVLIDGDLDEHVAAQAPAFATKRHRFPTLRRPLARFDPLVDVAEQGLVVCDAVL
jgi:serine/threonine-protein kinase RsbW